MKNAHFELGPIISPLRKPQLLENVHKAEDIRIISRSYFPSGSSTSDSSSCVVLRGNLDTNIVLLSPCLAVVARDAASASASVSATDSSLPSVPPFSFCVFFRNTVISRPRTCMGCSAFAYKVRLTPSTSEKMTSACPISGCTTIRWTSPNRWKTGRMSDLTVFGGRPVSVMVVVAEEGSVSGPCPFEDDVSGMDAMGSIKLDWKDGGIRIGRSDRVRPRVFWVRELLA